MVICSLVVVVLVKVIFIKMSWSGDHQYGIGARGARL